MVINLQFLMQLAIQRMANEPHPVDPLQYNRVDNFSEKFAERQEIKRNLLVVVLNGAKLI